MKSWLVTNSLQGTTITVQNYRFCNSSFKTGAGKLRITCE